MIEPIQSLSVGLTMNPHPVRSPRIEVWVTYISRPLLTWREFKGFTIPNKLSWVTFDLSGGDYPIPNEGDYRQY